MRFRKVLGSALLSLVPMMAAVSASGQTNVEDPIARGQCRLEPGYGIRTFTETFREATPATKNVTIVSDPALRTRAATVFADTGGDGMWWIHVNESLLCPGPEDVAAGVGIRDMIEHVAVHEACHIVEQGVRLKDPKPIQIEERMRLELQAERCAMNLLAAWNQERADKRARER